MNVTRLKGIPSNEWSHRTRAAYNFEQARRYLWDALVELRLAAADWWYGRKP